MEVRSVPVPPEFKTTEMAQKRMALERSAKAFAERYEELLMQYPGEWVGVTTAPDDRQPLVFHHANLDALHAALAESEIPTETVYIRFMADDPWGY